MALAAALALTCAWTMSRPVQAAPATTAADNARLPDPAYPKALALAAAGKPAQAIVQLDEQVHEQGAAAAPMSARLLRAQLLAQAGRAGESAAAWQAIAADSPALADFAWHSAFTALLTGHLLTDARTLIDPATAHGEHPDPMWFADLAAAFAKNGAADDAAALYQRVIDTGESGPAFDAACLGLASIREQQKNDAAALDLLRKLELNFDSPSSFLSAREAEKAIVHRTGRPPAPFTADQYASMVDHLSSRARYEPALALLEEWAAAPAAAGKADDIANRQVATLYALRDDDKSMAAANRFLATYPDSRFVPDVRIIQFRLDVREQRTPGVKSRGLALWLGRVPGVSREDRFSLGRLLAAYLVGIGQVRQGLSMYHRLYRDAVSRDDRADILWRAGVAAVRVHEYSRAIGNLRSAIDLKPGPLTERLCKYWIAAAQADEGHGRAAVDTLIDLLHEDSYDYYGLRASQLADRLVKGHPAWAADIRQAETPTQTFPPMTLQAATAQDAEFVAAGQLARAGLADEAAQLASDVARHHRDDSAAALLAARALSTVGRHEQAVGLLQRRFGPFLDQPAAGVPDDFWSMLYPRAFWTDVQAAAAANHVDPLLLLAIMRQESKFDATAVSVSGALGLFQVMTYTAADLGGAPGDPVQRADLLKPNVSAQLGARLVRRLMTLFHGEVAPVVASYNTGEDLVGVWWKKVPPGAGSEPLFVDTMPYGETRNYARTVLTNYYMYKRLYGG